MDQFGASATVSVCVMRTNFARVGVNVMSVRAPVPLPVATGLPHVLPSIDTVTL